MPYRNDLTRSVVCVSVCDLYVYCMCVRMHLLNLLAYTILHDTFAGYNPFKFQQVRARAYLLMTPKRH